MTILTQKLLSERNGNFALFAALIMSVVVFCVGSSIDLRLAYVERERMQQSLDAGVLAAVRKSSADDQREEIERIFVVNYQGEPVDFNQNLFVSQNSDKSITATLHLGMKTTFMGFAGIHSLPITVKASAVAVQPKDAGPCIYVLGSSGQDVIINEGADVRSKKCAIDVSSTANPAFVMNRGATIDFTSFCVKGTQALINPGGTLSNLDLACDAHSDPYADTLPEPTVSNTCTTTGALTGTAINMPTGVHCSVVFNGTPTITFAPGLHIIKGPMVINPNSTVIAKNVTFYFPDTSSEIRANGGLTFTGIAPTSGIYRGILMFEKTSDAANNANKLQYIFNGSKGEILEGLIYLPNRNVVYNSKTNGAAKITMVVNQMIFNPATWQIEPYDGGGAASVEGARLTE